jgi:hypothetical protein
MLRRALIPILLLAFAATLPGCRTEILVEIFTQVYQDRSLDRQVTITGREKPGEAPSWKDGTLATNAKVALANPDAWDRVETSTSTLTAEGFFTSPQDVPPLLTHIDDSNRAPDRQRLALQLDDLVVLQHVQYQETFGDPFGPADADAALDSLLGLLENWFREELELTWPDGPNLDGVRTFLQQEVRPAAREILIGRRALPGIERLEHRVRSWQKTFENHHIPIVALGDDEQDQPGYDRFWDAQTGPLLDWSRDRLARAVSTEELRVDPRYLTFIPSANNLESTLMEILARLWGSEEAGLEQLEPLFQAIQGHYGSALSPRYRFHNRVTLPGIPLVANGASEDQGWTWFFRGEEMAIGDVIHHAESVVLDLDALLALGARRDYSKAELMNLVDILAGRDLDDALKEHLRYAVQQGNLDTMTDGERVDALPEELRPLALELAALLRHPSEAD